VLTRYCLNSLNVSVKTMLKYLSIFKDVLKLYSYVGNTSFNGLLNDFKGFIVSIKCVILFSVNII